MKSELEIMIETKYKEELVEYFRANPESIIDAAELALGEDHNISWRAAWLVQSVIKKNDERIRPFIDKFIEVLPERHDSHQRELMKLLMKMKLDEEQQAKLFDHCMSIWEDLSRKQSVRYYAFKTILQIAEEYEELKQEIQFLLQDHYLESMSFGIKRSILNMVKKEIE
jgi:hypothetical protein